MLRFTKSFILLAFLALAASCSHKLAIVNPDKVERRKTAELVSAMDSMSQLRPGFFYTKIKCQFSDTNQNLNFKTSIRMVKDSVVNALITYASLPILNSLIRPDSVIISNKKDKCLIRRDLSYIKEQFGVSFDYKNIEELFLGLPIAFDTTQKYFQIHDPFNYIISSHKKREIRRENRNNDRPNRNNDRPNRRDNNNEEETEEENVILKYYLSADIKTVKRIFIDSEDDSTTIDIQYISRDSVDGFMIPNEVMVEIITPRNRLVLNMDYDKTEVNMPQEIVFVIPEDYEECSSK